MGIFRLEYYIGVVFVKFTKQAIIVGGIAAIGAALLARSIKNGHPANQNAWYAQEIQSGIEYTPEQIQLIAAEHHDTVAVVEAKISGLTYQDQINRLSIIPEYKTKLLREIGNINPAYQAMIFSDSPPPFDSSERVYELWKVAHS